MDGSSLVIDAGAEFVRHYGVKGQKWGVRRNQTSKTSSSSKKKAKKKSSVNDPLAKTKNLTNDELRKVVDRMRLEQQYIELSRSQSTATGKKVAAKILKTAGNTLVTALIGKGVAKSLSKAGL